MNKKKLLALLVSSAFLFAACGDDNSSSPSIDDSETEISSSSEEDECDSDECDENSSSSKKSENKSSSSKAGDKKSSDSKDEKSSSSKGGEVTSSSSTAKDPESSASVESSSSAESSSSVDVPQGAKAATLENLEKNIELNLFGQTVILSTGSKQGVISLRIPDELWVVTYTDFAGGEVTFAESNSGYQYAATDAAKAITSKLGEGFKISFIVDKDGKTKYAVDGSKEYKEAVGTKVSLLSGKISNAEKLKDKVYKCTDGDSTRTFTFFDNSYILENGVGNKVAYWNAGHYDIQRSTLLMRPEFLSQSGYSMYTYSVGTDNTISTMDGKSMSCNVTEMTDVVYQDSKKFVGEWQALKDGVDWTFTLKADGSYELLAFENNVTVELKKGSWSIYGNELLMHNEVCLDRTDRKSCTPYIYGKLEAGSVSGGQLEGFTFSHSDPDTPKIPTSFEAQQYE
jgi:hypothetical protein